MKRELLLAMAVVVLALSACGGGGLPPPQTTVAPTTLVVEETMASPKSVGVQGTVVSPATATKQETTPLQPEPEAPIDTLTPTPDVGIIIFEWPNYFRYIEDMEEFADAVVVAEVVVITHDAPQEASSLQHFYVQLRIIEDWSRSKLASDRVVVVNSGSGSGAFDEVDPRYTVGEEYLLFLRRQPERLQPGPPAPARYWTVSPQGRYRIENHRLEALTTRYPLNQELDGYSISDAYELVAKGQSPCWPEGLRVDAGAGWAYFFQSMEEMEKDADAIVVATVTDITEGTALESTPSGTPLEHTSVHLVVNENWGRLGIQGTIVIEQTGGPSTSYLREDPPYCVDEQYLLFLRRQRERGDPRTPKLIVPPIYDVFIPNGRYRIRDGTLKALTTDYPVNEELDGYSLDTAKRVLTLLRTTPAGQTSTANDENMDTYYSLEDLVRDADAIVVAEAVTWTSGRDVQPTRGGKPVDFVNFHFRVIDHWSRSRLPFNTFMIEVAGGALSAPFPENPHYFKGDQYLLFLRRATVGDYDTVIDSPRYSPVGPQGRYRIDDGKLVSGNPAIYRLSGDLDGQTLESIEAKMAELQTTPK